MIAQEIMVSQVQTLSPNYTIGEALCRFADLRFQAFPIIDENHRLLGTLNFWQIIEQAMPSYITKGDLPDVRFAPDLGQFHERLEGLKQKLVSHVMNSNAPCVRPEDSVLACAALIMTTPKTVYLLPVVEESRKLVGIISAWDILKKLVP